MHLYVPMYCVMRSSFFHVWCDAASQFGQIELLSKYVIRAVPCTEVRDSGVRKYVIRSYTKIVIL